ncbi:MAG: hypothetical protein IJB45_07180 [Clostridia bacterium]|nr:hypothetical protein [Clostridia bacterium]
MAVSFGGFNENTATFKVSGEIENGMPVKMSESGTVEACSDGDAFCGICRNTDGAYAAIQLSGAVKSIYSGADPECGFVKLAAFAQGVQVGGDREYLAVEVDTDEKTVTFIM